MPAPAQVRAAPVDTAFSDRSPAMLRRSAVKTHLEFDDDAEVSRVQKGFQ